MNPGGLRILPPASHPPRSNRRTLPGSRILLSLRVGVVLCITSLAGTAFPADPASLAPRAWREPRTGMELVFLPPGTFVQGTPEDEPQRELEERAHAVILARGVFMGRTEVTQAQWRVVMGTAPSARAGCNECPVEGIAWDEARAFAARLSRSSGRPFRLPTEAEWEYACRAGTPTAFATGDRISADDANIDGRGKTLPVASFPANAWGLHDLHGNVWEWTGDAHCPYPEGRVTDPVGACASDLKVIRGGSYLFGADSARCGLRYTHRPQDTGPSLGFRVVMEP